MRIIFELYHDMIADGRLFVDGDDKQRLLSALLSAYQWGTKGGT